MGPRCRGAVPALFHSRRDPLLLCVAVYAVLVGRIAWTDSRLDDLANRMDAGFARVDADIRELQAEIGGLRFALRVGGGIVIGLIGVIAAPLVSPIGG